MKLRRAVTALLCLAISNVFVAELHIHVAHSSAGDVVGMPDSDAVAGHAANDLDPHMNAQLHRASGSSDDGGAAYHAQCDHAHCCVAFIVLAGDAATYPPTLSRHHRPVDERISGLPVSPDDRPPIAIL